MDFAVPADHGVKLKESTKRDKYLDLARELKKLNQLLLMQLQQSPKELVQGSEDLDIRRREATIQMTVLLRSVGILKRVQETWRDLLSLRLPWKTFS